MAILRQAFGTATDAQTAKRLGRTPSSVREQRHRLGLYVRRQIRRRWTSEEERFLAEHHASMSDRRLAAKFGCSIQAVRHRRHRLGLVRRSIRRFTAKEDALIRRLGGKVRLDHLAARLGRRVSVLWERARILGAATRRKWVLQHGYRARHVGPNGAQRTVWEHIAVMERQIGRKLRKPECVHHINHDKLDNRPENLYLCNDRGHHSRVHSSIDLLVRRLMDRGIVRFNRRKGIYELAK